MLLQCNTLSSGLIFPWLCIYHTFSGTYYGSFRSCHPQINYNYDVFVLLCIGVHANIGYAMYSEECYFSTFNSSYEAHASCLQGS